MKQCQQIHTIGVPFLCCHFPLIDIPLMYISLCSLEQLACQFLHQLQQWHTRRTRMRTPTNQRLLRAAPTKRVALSCISLWQFSR